MKICIADESPALHNSTALVLVFLHDLSFVYNLISLQYFVHFKALQAEYKFHSHVEFVLQLV